MPSPFLTIEDVDPWKRRQKELREHLARLSPIDALLTPPSSGPSTHRSLDSDEDPFAENLRIAKLDKELRWWEQRGIPTAQLQRYRELRANVDGMWERYAELNNQFVATSLSNHLADRIQKCYQGDIAFVTPEAMLKRTELRHDETVLAALDQLWSCMPKTPYETIDRSIYDWMHAKLYGFLYPKPDKNNKNHTQKEALESDWEEDTQGRPTDELDKEMFYDAIYMCTDIWVDTVNVEDYVSFVVKLCKVLDANEYVSPEMEIPDNDEEEEETMAKPMAKKEFSLVVSTLDQALLGDEQEEEPPPRPSLVGPLLPEISSTNEPPSPPPKLPPKKPKLPTTTTDKPKRKFLGALGSLFDAVSSAGGSSCTSSSSDEEGGRRRTKKKKKPKKSSSRPKIDIPPPNLPQKKQIQTTKPKTPTTFKGPAVLNLQAPAPKKAKKNTAKTSVKAFQLSSPSKRTRKEKDEEEEEDDEITKLLNKNKNEEPQQITEKRKDTPPLDYRDVVLQIKKRREEEAQQKKQLEQEVKEQEDDVVSESAIVAGLQFPPSSGSGDFIRDFSPPSTAPPPQEDDDEHHHEQKEKKEPKQKQKTKERWKIKPKILPRNLKRRHPKSPPYLIADKHHIDPATDNITHKYKMSALEKLDTGGGMPIRPHTNYHPHGATRVIQGQGQGRLVGMFTGHAHSAAEHSGLCADGSSTMTMMMMNKDFNATWPPSLKPEPEDGYGTEEAVCGPSSVRRLTPSGQRTHHHTHRSQEYHQHVHKSSKYPLRATTPTNPTTATTTSTSLSHDDHPSTTTTGTINPDDDDNKGSSSSSSPSSGLPPVVVSPSTNNGSPTTSGTVKRGMFRGDELLYPITASNNGPTRLSVGPGGGVPLFVTTPSDELVPAAARNNNNNNKAGHHYHAQGHHHHLSKKNLHLGRAGPSKQLAALTKANLDEAAMQTRPSSVFQNNNSSTLPRRAATSHITAAGSVHGDPMNLEITGLDSVGYKDVLLCLLHGRNVKSTDTTVPGLSPLLSTFRPHTMHF